MSRGERITQTFMDRGYDRKEAKELAIQIILNLDNYERIQNAMRQRLNPKPEKNPRNYLK